MTKVMMLNGSVRPTGNGVKIGAWAKGVAKGVEGIELDYVEVKDLNLPFFAEAFSPKYRSPGVEYSTPEGQAWAKRVNEADAYVFITPEYNHSIPGALKNALDSAGFEWSNKKAVVVSYSLTPTAGVRASEHLIQVLYELGVTPVSGQVLIGDLMKAANPDYSMDEAKLDAIIGSSTDFLEAQIKKLV